MPVTWSGEKLILLYCPGRARTHDLPHNVASNMGKVSHAITHSATDDIDDIVHVERNMSNNSRVTVVIDAT